MPEVGDKAAGQPGVGQGLADHARCAVQHRWLGVEQVGDHSGARVGCRGHLIRGGVAVTHADQHARLGEPGDRRDGAGSFGGQGDQPEEIGRGLQQLVQGGR